MSSITITNESTQLPNYGVSVQRSGINNLVSQSSSDGIALFNSLKSDMLTNWTLYNGTPESGNEIKIQTSTDSAAINLTKQFFTFGHVSRALSTVFLSGIIFPPLNPTSEVTINFDSQSLILPAIDSEENPPKIIEWIAPILEQASITYASSGIIVR